ncbi:MAG TPA: P1 family peptidase [Vicinamibacterales bacterium]|jgi:L-aminopeptidase/D-esterase-like protein
MNRLMIAFLAVFVSVPSAQTPRVRARDLGIVVGTLPTGPLNAITDVSGVLVGHATIIRGDGELKIGTGPVRTGLTAVLPRKDIWFNGVYAATHTLNGDGEMTGTHWIRDRETLMHPVLITNTGSVGTVHEAEIAYMNERHPTRDWAFLPVVAETWDGTLNDVRGQHVKKTHVFAAIDDAKGGPVAEGNVGGGTGMVCYAFKGGIGTSSRKTPAAAGGYTVGVLVQANFGRRPELTISGVPVGREISDLMPETHHESGPAADVNLDHEGSVIVVIATDAPLSSRQLERLASRAALGLARTGSTSGNTSGDIFIAFSSANTIPQSSTSPTVSVTFISPESTATLNPLFQAVVEATEESVINALTKADTMTGINGNRVYALPYDRLSAVMAKYGRK